MGCRGAGPGAGHGRARLEVRAEAVTQGHFIPEPEDVGEVHEYRGSDDRVASGPASRSHLPLAQVPRAARVSCTITCPCAEPHQPWRAGPSSTTAATTTAPAETW